MNKENEKLKNKILDLAIRGKLVPQDPNDEPASVLLEKIKTERKKLISEKKIKKEKYSEIYKDSTDNHYYEKFEDGTIKDITEEISFDIPDSWKWCRINYFSNIFTGNSISEDIKKEKYTNIENGYNYISTKDVEFDTTINYENGIKIPFLEKNFKKAYENNTLICIEGGNAGKKIGYLTEDVCFGNKLATFDSWLIEPKYIFFVLQSSILKKFFKENMTGIIGGVSVNTLKKFICPVPPIEEQKRIVFKLENSIKELNLKEYNDNTLNKLKELLKCKILDKAIKGELVHQCKSDEPASVLIQKILDKKMQLMNLKEIKKENLSIIYKDSTDNQFYEKFDDGTIHNITDEIPFDIPDNWCWSRLANLVSKQIKRGKSPKYKEKSNVYVLAQKCNQKNGIISLKNAKFLDETTLKKYDESDYVTNLDIVINSTGNGTLGRIGIIDNKDIYLKKIVVDSHITLIRLFKEIQSKYIFYFLKHNQKYLESQATGSTNQTELSPEIIKKLLIPIPPLKEQIKIIRKIDEIFEYKKTAE